MPEVQKDVHPDLGTGPAYRERGVRRGEVQAGGGRSDTDDRAVCSDVEIVRECICVPYEDAAAFV